MLPLDTAVQLWSQSIRAARARCSQSLRGGTARDTSKGSTGQSRFVRPSDLRGQLFRRARRILDSLDADDLRAHLE